MKRGYLLLFLAPLLLFAFACSLPNVNQPAPAGSPQSSPAAGTGGAALTIQNDPARGLAVLVTSSGTKLDISATADDGSTVACADALGVAPLSDGSGSLSLSASSMAIIVGTRSDGNPGAWVYSSGKIEGVIDEDSGQLTSRLPECGDQNGVFRGQFGWVYHVQGRSEDGRVIVGYAENKKGINRGRFQVDPGTTIGVYWKISKHPHRPFFMASRAHIIGTFDLSKIQGSPKPVRRIVNAILRHALDQLKFLLIDYLSTYLIMVDKDGVHYDSLNNVYLVSGTDQDDQPAVATIDQKGNITITETQSGGGPSIYVAGSYNAPSNVACYWKDGTRVDLDTGGNTPAFATGIAVSGSTVYVGGYYYDNVKKAYVGCYWINGARTDLPGANANVYSLFVSGGTIYTAGFYNNGATNVACYWVGNANPTALSSNVSTAYSIFVDNGTVYAAGFDDVNAAWWKGTVETPLSTDAVANAIVVSGGAVYLAGQVSISTTPNAVTWTNGTLATLSTNASNATSIFVSGGTVYVAGQDGTSAVSWANGMRTVLDSTSTSMSNAITVSNGTVYNAGQNGASASYWTGTARTDFTDVANAQATSIVVQ